MKPYCCYCLGLAWLLLPPLATTRAADWTVPVGGNAFRTAPAPGNQGFQRNHSLTWDDPAGVYSVYVHLDRPAVLKLAMTASVADGTSILETRCAEHAFRTEIRGSQPRPYQIGSLTVEAAGYVRIDFQGIEREGRDFGSVRELLLASDTADLQVDFVKSNDGNMFYWGRRGPSVHLRYEVPSARPWKYAYCEITVPVGQDPIGSYFMANGFAEGYFGMQVNSSAERRVLFSVWSPFQTDNPRDIPEDERIVLLGKGSQVHVGEFGNEGSGGQSFLVYPWRAGTSYRFLTEVVPDGQGRTRYTSWFGDKAADEWQLIASFLRPKTDTSLKGFHSFLENFSPSFGYRERRADYGNIWVADAQLQWHECTQARFSVDATGGGRHRLDFQGGAEQSHFFLRNGGFFNEPSQPGARLTRDSTAAQQPRIDFDALPRG